MFDSGNFRRFAQTPAEDGECANFARARASATQELAAGLNGIASNAAHRPPPKHAVAIPVRNETRRILACIDALAAQRDGGNQPFPVGSIHVVLLFNNCSDGSFALAKSQLARWPLAITAYDVVLPDELSHVGHARRLANHAALRDLPSDGVLFMSDADSRVPADWIACHSALVRTGCEAIAGMAELSPDDHGDIPPSLMHRSALEERYARLLDELESTIDPLAHDPWPRHYSACGANMAVRAGAMRRLDDFPDVACGEDRQLIASLERADQRVRHDTETRVLTSGRLFGRAVGGKADTLRHRVVTPEAACDERLECAATAQRRATLRAHLRSIWTQAKRSDRTFDTLAADSGLASTTLREVCAMPRFGDAWNMFESCVPGLSRLAIPPSRLALEIGRCEDLLGATRRASGRTVSRQRAVFA